MKKICRVLCVILVFVFMGTTIYAHSGRTDSSGGHNDNNNVSGLGSYHYHHGYGPHLHENGICPYSPKDTISIENQPTTMETGEVIALKWTVTYYSGSSVVTWESSDESILEVEQGNLIAKSPGKVNITANLKNGIKTFAVTVKEVEVAEVEILNGIDRVEIGETIELGYKVYPDNATYPDVLWESSDTDIAIVEDGIITAKSEGSVTFTAQTENGKSASHTLEVYCIYPELVDIKFTEDVVYLGDAIILTASVEPENTTNNEIKWESSDELIATINSKGEIQLLKEGNVEFSASCQETSDSIEVKVQRIPVETIQFNVEKMDLDLGVMKKGDATVIVNDISPVDATYKDVLYRTSNPNIVQIEGNELVAVGYGKAIIYAENLDAEAEMEIWVINIPLLVCLGAGICLLVAMMVIIIYRKNKIKGSRIQ